MSISTPGDISVAPTVGMLFGTLLIEVNCKDGVRIYALAGVYCRVWAQKSVVVNEGMLYPSMY